MDELITTGNSTLYLILILSAAPVIVATLIGLVVGLFQTVTQLQEQTLPYGAKLLGVVLCLMIMLGWGTSRMIEFGLKMFELALTG